MQEMIEMSEHVIVVIARESNVITQRLCWKNSSSGVENAKRRRYERGEGKKRCDNRTFVFQNVINEQVFILMKCKT